MRKYTRNSLKTVIGICKELETVFGVFNIDKVWSEDGTKVTLAFTAERLKTPFRWK